MSAARGRIDSAAEIKIVLSRNLYESTVAAVRATAARDRSYEMRCFVGPDNHLPAVSFRDRVCEDFRGRFDQGDLRILNRRILALKISAEQNRPTTVFTGHVNHCVSSQRYFLAQDMRASSDTHIRCRVTALLTRYGGSRDERGLGNIDGHGFRDHLRVLRRRN